MNNITDLKFEPRYLFIMHNSYYTLHGASFKISSRTSFQIIYNTYMNYARGGSRYLLFLLHIQNLFIYGKSFCQVARTDVNKSINPHPLIMSLHKYNSDQTAMTQYHRIATIRMQWIRVCIESYRFQLYCHALESKRSR